MQYEADYARSTSAQARAEELDAVLAIRSFWNGFSIVVNLVGLGTILIGLGGVLLVTLGTRSLLGDDEGGDE
jgi:uncharacterized membrane protein